MPEAKPWYQTKRGPPVVAGYAILTLAVLAVSSGWLLEWPSGVADASVPGYVYLYGFLGGMTYAFTSLVAKFERGIDGVVRVGIRALAALPLAAGVYLLAVPLGVPADSVRLLAGLSFLVGLYVNVALKALGGLADRLFGRVRSGTSTGDSPVAGSDSPSPEPATRPTEGSGTVADGSGSSES